MIGASRPRRTYRYLAVMTVAGMLLTGFIALWMPGAVAQDQTGVEGTAVAPYTPTPVPTSSITPRTCGPPTAGLRRTSSRSSSRSRSSATHCCRSTTVAI